MFIIVIVLLVILHHYEINNLSYVCQIHRKQQILRMAISSDSQQWKGWLNLNKFVQALNWMYEYYHCLRMKSCWQWHLPSPPTHSVPACVWSHRIIGILQLLTERMAVAVCVHINYTWLDHFLWGQELVCPLAYVCTACMYSWLRLKVVPCVAYKWDHKHIVSRPFGFIYFMGHIGLYSTDSTHSHTHNHIGSDYMSGFTRIHTTSWPCRMQANARCHFRTPLSIIVMSHLLITSARYLYQMVGMLNRQWMPVVYSDGSILILNAICSRGTSKKHQLPSWVAVIGYS